MVVDGQYIVSLEDFIGGVIEGFFLWGLFGVGCDVVCEGIGLMRLLMF